MSDCFIFWEKKQVLKKISIFFLSVLVLGCSQTGRDKISMQGGSYDTSMGRPADSSFFEDENNFKVGMLLPLSGKSAVYGQGLRNAAMMAVEDADNSRLVINFYDTQSTPSGASMAAHQALDDEVKLILGPLTKDEVSAVSSSAASQDVPVISFSTSQNILGNGVYTLGLLSDEQVERIIAYAVSQGRKKIALLVPDTPSGLNIAKSAFDSAVKHNAELVKIGFYPPDTMDFGDIVKQMSDYETRSQEITERKKILTAQAQAGDKQAEHQLKLLKTTYTTGELDFDAVLIPETGNRLKSAASMFGYYDVSYPDVLFLGTSVWESTDLSKETTLYKGLYPAISRVHNDYFNKKYQSYFGQLPNQLYSFAYDGVALASSLSRKKTTDLTPVITDEEGYIGINGAFRILADGSNQHALDIMEVSSYGPQTVDKAAKEFPVVEKTIRPLNYVSPMPKIYGKDAAAVENILFSSPDEGKNKLPFVFGW